MILICAIPTTIEKYVVVYYVEVYANSNGRITYQNPFFQQPKHNEEKPKKWTQHLALRLSFTFVGGDNGLLGDDDDHFKEGDGTPIGHGLDDLGWASTN